MASRFTRGWTLQELIAPRNVVFYNAPWSFVGDKDDLHHELADITSIRERILLKRDDLAEEPVALKMSWASTRKTTRVEDMAYCLL